LTAGCCRGGLDVVVVKETFGALSKRPIFFLGSPQIEAITMNPFGSTLALARGNHEPILLQTDATDGRFVVVVVFILAPSDELRAWSSHGFDISQAHVCISMIRQFGHDGRLEKTSLAITGVLWSIPICMLSTSGLARPTSYSLYRSRSL
jgi:hypothetical protein